MAWDHDLEARYYARACKRDMRPDGLTKLWMEMIRVMMATIEHPEAPAEVVERWRLMGTPLKPPASC